MLSAEVARGRLEKLEIKDAKEQHVDAARKLGPHEHAVAIALMDRAGSKLALQAYSQAADQQDKIIEAWSTLAARGRRRVLALLFPRFTAQVEAALALFDRLPYQDDYTRKPFRAPGAQALTGRRVRWLMQLFTVTCPYDQPVEWFAAWTPYLPHWMSGATLAPLFAAAIEAGGPDAAAVYEVLLASGRGEHEIGAMGSHVVRSLLIADRRDGWEFVERLLLAAQGQEGLRQAIFESADECHPDFFPRLLRLIADHDLTRFASCARAVSVWLGLSFEAAKPVEIRETLLRVANYLDAVQREALDLAPLTPEETYLALWALAFHDAVRTMTAAHKLLSHPNPGHRVAALSLLALLRLNGAVRACASALEDGELAVSVVALQGIAGASYETLKDTDTFAALARIFPRYPKRPTSVQLPIWDAVKVETSQAQVAGALYENLWDRPVDDLLPYLPLVPPGYRGEVAKLLAQTAGATAEGSPARRQALFDLLADQTEFVRDQAAKALKKAKLSPAEAPQIEALLTRKAADLRRHAIALLLAQEDSAALSSAERLLAAKQEPQRLAGLEILRELVGAGREVTACEDAARRFRDQRPALSTAEQALLDGLGGASAAPEPQRSDAFGLSPLAQRTPRPTLPFEQQGSGLLDRLKRLVGRGQPELLITPAALACLRSLDAFILEHRETPIPAMHGEGARLLGDSTWGLPIPWQRNADGDPEPFPLADLWETWCAARPAGQRDADGCELLRAWTAARYGEASGWKWTQEPGRILLGWGQAPKLSYPRVVDQVLRRLACRHAPATAPDFLLDAFELTLSLVPQRAIDSATGEHEEDDEDDEKKPQREWVGFKHIAGWLDVARAHRTRRPELWTTAHKVRLWQQLCWINAGSQHERVDTELEDLLPALEAGAATMADLYALLLAYPTNRYPYLPHHSTVRPTPLRVKYPALDEAIAASRRRIVEIELGRGELPTAATELAAELQYTGGLQALVALLRGLGKEGLVRHSLYFASEKGKRAIFSHLIKRTYPDAQDTPEVFAQAMREAGIAQARLIELAMFAPQWARHVEAALGWPGLTDGVWWLRLHTAEPTWYSEQELRERWSAEAAQYTSLATKELEDGAVDVAAFRKAYAKLGPERWDAVYQVALLASTGPAHKRAQLFADAILGRVTEAELIKRIEEKRHQDSVRALGLLPLPAADAQAAILKRYNVFQEFLRTGREFGAQRRTNEKLAVEIGMENLARTAGYPDPRRLQWALEAGQAADLAQGPVIVQSGGYEVALSLDSTGHAEITATKGGKALATLPAALRKTPEIAAVLARRDDLRKQVSRVRQSLEEAMIRGDMFTAEELVALTQHPVLNAQLRNLALISDSCAGYATASGDALIDGDGKLVSLSSSAQVRIAHPYDLLKRGDWHLWQRECVASERRQPFKQVFRELYLLTENEIGDGNASRRYAGHQVQTNRALGLLAARGWVNHPDEGIRKTYHREDLTAWLGADMGYWTPAETEGARIETVWFSRRGEWTALPLTDIPPLVFSETMRDLDLVVSVAHATGVDPEASASTVEMRGALVRETAAMLKLGNVTVKDRHALVQGELGSYSVHLGSAVVHRQPGGALCIVPVHAQQRGRLFLPFADDDPKTAEVVAKVLLLARDKQIKDPVILEQILRVR